MDWQALIAELGKPAYASADDQAAADLLNDPTVAAKVSVAAHDIKRYLTLTGKRSLIAQSAEPAATTATLALADFIDFDAADPAVLAALTGVLDGLATAALISADDKTAILALGDAMISPAESLGIAARPITAGDVQAARRRMN